VPPASANLQALPNLGQISKNVPIKKQVVKIPNTYNRILWAGRMGDKPYPAVPSGADLRQHREELLAQHRESLKQEAAPESRTGVD
jgi:hypothetical protein